MMRTKLTRWILALGMLALIAGCGGGGDDNIDELTVANLQGAYDLDISRSTLGDFIDDDVVVVSGTLDVDGMISTLTVTGSQTQMFVITDTTTITVTDDDGDMTDIQTTVTNNGATVTILTSLNGDGDTLVFEKRGAGTGNDLTLANLQGTYDLNIAASSPLQLSDDDLVIQSGVLEVMDTTLTFTATGASTTMYTITSGGTVSITEADGDVIDLRATLSNNTTTLRLVQDDGDVMVFNKR